MRSKAFSTLFLFLLLVTCAQSGGDNNPDIPDPPTPPAVVYGQAVTPKPHQIKWSTAELGVVFHYDLHVFDNKRYSQPDNRLRPVDDYNIFNPENLDTDQWAKAAKDMGAKFAILTATHETGFGLWQSDCNPYSLRALRWRDGKGDIVADFVKSCRKYDIMPGIYVGIRWNSMFGIYNFAAQGSGDYAALKQAWYKQCCCRMVEELCSRYGDLFMIWFDGGADDPAGLGPDVEPIVNRLQPECLFYHNVNRADLRWGGSESGTVDYPCWSTFPYPYSHSNSTTAAEHTRLLKQGDPDGKYWVPAMADTPLRGANGRHEWFWEPGDENNVYPLSTLMTMYERSVGRNATLIVGVTPSPEGVIPEGDVERMREWGSQIESVWGEPAASNSTEGQSCMVVLDKESVVDRYVIEEDIASGQRIRAYRIDALVDGNWTTVAEGKSVGNKRLARFAPVSSKAFCLTVTDCVAKPIIKQFGVYNRQ